jgi:hypothetical protein|tara:strand:- start:638 stop:1105 length:468 start_codon:yes stop_codon:yes gene_type:complete
MRKLLFKLIALIFSISLLSIQSFAVEGMSPEEMEIREEHDRIKKELYGCYAINNVDPRDIDDSVCQKEREALIRSEEEFNKFMEMKRAKEEEIPYKIRKERYNAFLEEYSSYTEEMLEELHKTHCQTKWGSSASSECNAIAQQLAEKRNQRLISQ